MKIDILFSLSFSSRSLQSCFAFSLSLALSLFSRFARITSSMLVEVDRRLIISHGKREKARKDASSYHLFFLAFFLPLALFLYLSLAFFLLKRLREDTKIRVLFFHRDSRRKRRGGGRRRGQKEDKEELHKGSKVERHDTIRHARSPLFLRGGERRRERSFCRYYSPCGSSGQTCPTVI